MDGCIRRVEDCQRSQDEATSVTASHLVVQSRSVGLADWQTGRLVREDWAWAWAVESKPPGRHLPGHPPLCRQ